MALPRALVALARDIDVHPEKFRDLIALYEGSVREAQEAAFHAAFLKMQPHLPVIDEHGEIEYKDGRKGTYALNEDIQAAVGPILNQYGFYLSFETAMSTTTGILTHRKGYKRRSSFTAPPDLSGEKTTPQGRGSIIAYAHRYTSCDLLNLTKRGADRDASLLADQGPKPYDFEPFMDGLHKGAEAGSVVLAEAWAQGSEEQRAYVRPHYWAFLKERAATRV